MIQDNSKGKRPFGGKLTHFEGSIYRKGIWLGRTATYSISNGISDLTLVKAERNREMFSALAKSGIRLSVTKGSSAR